MNIQKIKTLGELKKSGYKPRSIKEEIRNNLIEKIKNKERNIPNEQIEMSLHKKTTSTIRKQAIRSNGFNEAINSILSLISPNKE